MNACENVKIVTECAATNTTNSSLIMVAEIVGVVAVKHVVLTGVNSVDFQACTAGDALRT